MIKKLAKECFDAACEHPSDGWQCAKMFGGAAFFAILGAIYYALLALFEKITGKDYLHRGTESSIPTKETGSRKEKV